MKWKDKMQGKKRGGMGTKKLRLHNKSLLFEWLWRYSDEKEELWKEVINTKYGKMD